MPRAVVVVLAVALTGAVWVATAPDAPPAAAAVARSSPEVVTVSVRDDVFVPSTIDVARGTVVRWENDGRNVHNVRSNAPGRFASRDLATGQSFATTFDTPGTYAYYCSLHGAPGNEQ